MEQEKKVSASQTEDDEAEISSFSSWWSEEEGSGETGQDTASCEDGLLCNGSDDCSSDSGSMDVPSERPFRSGRECGWSPTIHARPMGPLIQSLHCAGIEDNGAPEPVNERKLGHDCMRIRPNRIRYRVRRSKRPELDGEVTKPVESDHESC